MYKNKPNFLFAFVAEIYQIQAEILIHQFVNIYFFIRNAILLHWILNSLFLNAQCSLKNIYSNIQFIFYFCN